MDPRLTDTEDEEGDKVGVSETDSSLRKQEGRRRKVSKEKRRVPNLSIPFRRRTHSDVSSDQSSDKATDGEDTSDDRLPRGGDSAYTIGSAGSESG